MRRRRPTKALLALVASAALLIGAAGQLAKMIVPESAPRTAAADVAPVLIGGFLIGAAAQFLDGGGQTGPQERHIAAMNKAELVGA
ncbi:hypothetical protein AB0G74_16220 [Streptomyces sp. NPDC020875]|uniref:hypothetical protein n=1 Tax=Streptomyces sp. NPDC020875 TaxID=3154898 RepID=UPI0034033370